ncbi:MAG: right-handed parallel beta-helix repeat-containing protein, partial [Deltaproteobacteria bacterium]|nr:right-handed parallel beta-helix repeat-containing protein [Deltaproteobacteria bacterium]
AEELVDELLGRGIQVQVDRDTGKRVTLVLRGSLVEQNHDTGVFVSGSDATIEGTVVRGTLPRPSDQLLGLGIQVQDDPDAGERATLTLRGSIVEQNHDIGVFVYGSDATIEGCRIANTVPNMLGPFGHGIQASDSPTTGERATLTLRGSLVEHNHALGVLVTGSDATVEGTVVRDSLPQASDQLLGRGIDVQYDPDAGERATLVLRGSLVEQSHEAGVFVVDSDATIDGCRIVHTLPNHFGRFGDGLVVAGLPAQPASARVVATRIEQSARAALSNFGASMTHGSTLMQCQSFDLEGEPNGGSNFSFDHLGGSLCGCPVADRECAVLSAGLDPPDLAEPSTPTR